MKESLKAALEKESRRFEEFYLWLEKSMSDVFFKEVDREWISLIVHALMGFEVQDYFVEIHFKTSAITLCLDSPQADIDILKSYPLYGIKNYTTYISKHPLPFPGKGLLRIATLHFTQLEKETDILSKMPTQLFEKAKGSDACQYEMLKEEEWQAKGMPSMRLVLAWKNVPKHNFLYRFAKAVDQHGLVMQKVRAAYVNVGKTDSILVFSLGLHGSLGQPAWEACDLEDFLQEITMLKYFGSQDPIEETFVIPKLMRGNLANLLRSMMHFIHQVLVHSDPNLYSLENVQEGLTRHPELTVKLCEAFEWKFHPKRHDLKKFQEVRGEYALLVKQLDTGQEILDQRRKNVLLQGMNFVEHTLKTNFYVDNKTSLAFRLDPRYLEHVPFERGELFPQLPYGVFFFKGMHHVGFHVRFKDLARGGLRTIYPEKKERVLAERGTVFFECYHLAYTQHKKNKDIPEGGAKGVIFLKPYERLEQEAAILRHELEQAGRGREEVEKQVTTFVEQQKIEYLYQTQRSYIQTFLSLINCEPDGALRTAKIVDYWKRPEYIYLGPDENMHNVMIEWIAGESKRVGYKPGGAFISGKSKMGINHKEYGVTSLGVNVYMEEALRYLGINPFEEPFTVKMTGGPDGDVAGNQIKNLLKYFPHTAKLVALTDVSGTIFDPKGLDLQECVALFEQQLAICHYPTTRLHSGGFLLDRGKRREMTPYVFQTLCTHNREGLIVEEWLHGNEMNALFRHNVHKAVADMFIPCGGRPRTLRETNIEEFMDERGRPTARAIVEGANLYLSPEGRRVLEERGVLIIKDSSANKCGVISSSFEILAGLTLSDEEFLQNKPQLVTEILERLKELSRAEAHLLLQTHAETKERMTVLSDKISERINHYTDQMLQYLDTQTLTNDPSDPLTRCFLHYNLRTLREGFGERLLREIPESHKRAVIASHIASRVVYRRGLSWSPSLIEILPLILQDAHLFE